MNKTMMNLGLTAAVLLMACGCSTPGKYNSTTLQGSWSGHELDATPDSPRHLVISGTQLDYHGSDNDDWGKGTFTLREDTDPKQLLLTLTDCGPTQYIGKTSCVIYKIENGTLTMAGSEPGNSTPPTSFQDSNARRMIFKKE